MELVAKQPAITKNIQATRPLSITEKFNAFCERQEKNRILLMSVMVLIQTCVFVPVTLLVSSFVDLGLSGAAVALLLAGTVGVLVTNMSEASIKAIFITFTLSAITNIILLAIHALAL